MKPYAKARGMGAFAEAKRDVYARDGYLRSRRDGDYDPCDWPERLDEIRALLRQVDPDELLEVLDLVAHEWPWFQRAAVAWIDLIDALVHNAERRYAARGRGELKREEVKGVIVYLLHAERFDIPRVPTYLGPVVIDVVADISVDAVVELLNLFQPDSWVEATATPPVAELPRRALLWVKRFLTRFLFEPVARAAARVYLWFRRPRTLTPAVRTAVEAVATDSNITRRGGALHHLATIARGLARNRASLVAGVQIVGIVIDVVEDLSDMSGRQKKECAKRLFYDVVEDLGFDTSSWIVRVKLDVALDVAIDAVVALFNKRDVLDHRDRLTRRTTARIAVRHG